MKSDNGLVYPICAEISTLLAERPRGTGVSPVNSDHGRDGHATTKHRSAKQNIGWN
jgi:hypothetical protein